MIGAFIQLNDDSPQAAEYPVGYVVCESGCWEWVGCKNHRGYGLFFADGKLRIVHRVIYERAKGAIPDGFAIDHLCRKRDCVNPDHLEAVSHKENNSRSSSPSAENEKKTHCKNGHEFTESNTYRYPGANKRRCVTCHAKWARDKYRETK